eukprot:3301447-Rhodomonas_salina.1
MMIRRDIGGGPYRMSGPTCSCKMKPNASMRSSARGCKITQWDNDSESRRFKEDRAHAIPRQ